MSLHFFNSTFTGTQSSFILFIIFYIPNYFSAFYEIYSSLGSFSKTPSIPDTLLIYKFPSGLMAGSPVSWLTYCQCLYFMPWLLKTRTKGKFLRYYLIWRLRKSSTAKGPSIFWVFDLVGLSFMLINRPLSLIAFEFMVFSSFSITYGSNLKIGILVKLVLRAS